MPIAPVLEQVVLAYSPVFDRQLGLVSTRLTVFPAAPGAVPDGAALLDAIADAFADAPSQSTALPALWLNVADEAWLDAVLDSAQRAPRPFLLEVASFMAPAREGRLQALKAAGQALAAGGLSGVEARLRPAFRYAAVTAAERTAVSARSPLPLPWLCSGTRTAADIDGALEQGAQAASGWPMDDDIAYATPTGVPPEVKGIVELMNRLEREEPPDRLEAVLTADPTLAFRLLRYLNSAAFGLRAEVTSFRHALMMLGHQRLKRWLALLLASGSPNREARPLLPVAARRGLLLDELARQAGDDTMRAEMFIVGVFSMLDRMLRQPMSLLMSNLPVHERVQQTLLHRAGPYQQHLALVQAIEQGASADIQAAAKAALVSRGELNQALLRALSLARELD
jgi:EAL and modified HD-GYP domain-containing signal transduction protein